MVREIQPDELEELLSLYLHLHENTVPEMSNHLRDTWDRILSDPNHHIIVYEEDGRLVSSCVSLIIPNLTRGVRPYALIENVVTHAAYRGRGYATACLNYAKELAIKQNCYKIMLSTGSRQESTLQFYRNAGYDDTVKTAFVQNLD
ncbi:MAG: GNAT family N-acetyltransferase [Ruminococcaceae bacterium]|nr:GNAT family N-acetyltransferase [Oscillospiraceae bacterium]